MEQTNINIGNIDLPIIVDEHKEWFPITFLSSKILLRNNSFVSKNGKYGNYIRKYKIKYGEYNTQFTNCINKEGLIEVLKNTHIGRLTSEQRSSQNLLHRYLEIDILPEDEQDTIEFKGEWFNKIDDYTKDVINNELNTKNVEWFRMCSKCLKHFPLTSRFYSYDSRCDKNYSKICKICRGENEYFHHQSDTVDNLKMIGLYEERELFKIYTAYKNKELKRLPECYENKESYEKIIKELYNIGELTTDNLTYEYITKSCRLPGISRYMNIFDIYQLLFGEDFYFYHWKYPKFSFTSLKLTYEIANQIVKNYIYENKIEIKNIFEYDYMQLFTKCRIKKLINNNILDFIVQFYEYKYPGYMFSSTSVNYYKNNKCLLFDLKYLIENDMKLDIDKIPLYLTKVILRKKCNSLYHFIITNKNGSIFKWIDQLYPNKFIETDFEINAYRDEFGSDTECFINEILNENFKNVIYNQIHTDRTIEINGMIPDWLIMTNTGVYIVEYFGLYEERQYGKSQRVTEYIDKTKRKIDKYKEMSGYKFLFLYPEDIEDDYKGCRDKILKIKETLI